MSPTNVIDLVVLYKTIRDRLDALPTTDPVTTGFLSEADHVPLLADKTHVQRYWVLHPFGGNPDVEADLADVNVQLAWGFQLTIAGASAPDVYELATDANSLLYRWTPVIDGYAFGRLRPPPGYDPGPARPDKDFNPHRFWLPLQYQTTITRAS